MGLREIRQQLRLTQQDLAHMVGVRVATVSDWESGRVVPHARHRRALARRLGVPESELGFADPKDVAVADS